MHFLSLLAAGLKKLYPYIIISLLFLGAAYNSQAQTYRIKGYVLDSSRNYPMELVSVISSSGKGTVTNSIGYYELEVSEQDTIWFSYLNKSTMKFPVAKISNPMQFDISLQVNVPVLKEVKISPQNSKQSRLLMEPV